MLPFDKEVHRIQKPSDTDRYVVIQKIGGLRDFQIDGRGLVFEFQFHFAFALE